MAKKSKPKKVKKVGKVQRQVSIGNVDKRKAEGWKEISRNERSDLVLMEK